MDRNEKHINGIDCSKDDPFARMLLYFDSLVKEISIYEEINFEYRVETIDFIDFELLPELAYQSPVDKNKTRSFLSIKKNAEKLKFALKQVDDKLFQKLRADIQHRLYQRQEFINVVKQYVRFDLTDKKHLEAPGYDNVDIFLNGLLHSENIPEQTLELLPDMVYYQKTPARIVFELTERLMFTSNDVFVDLGSGLGQVAILVNLLTAIKTVGIELEPNFCAYSAKSAAALNLTDVSFINTNARDACYTEGTVFFMFTPFKGEIMKDVLAALHKESLTRKLKIATYGPCTGEVVLQSWLYNKDTEIGHDYKLTVFSSL